MESDTVMCPNRHPSPKLLVTVACALSTLLSSACCSHAQKTYYRTPDQAWVDKAVELHFGPGQSARREADRTAYPVVLHLKDDVCVGFILKPNTLGGDFTICFAKRDGSVVSTHTEGE